MWNKFGGVPKIMIYLLVYFVHLVGAVFRVALIILKLLNIVKT